MVIAVCAALAAGAFFACAGVLQQQAATTRPEQEVMSLRLLAHLVRQPMWLFGIGLALLAYVFQSMALAYGPLSLVQPLIVSELVFAIPLAARLQRIRLRRREWLGAACVTGGLAAALAAANPHGGTPRAGVSEWVVVLSAVAAAAVTALLVSRLAREAARASLIAAAAGLVMGTQSVLLAVVVQRVGDQGVAALFTAWHTYVLIAASIVGLLLIQSAFQAGPISASMPTMDAMEPTVAIAIGVLLFGEALRLTAVTGVVAACGVVVLFIGIVVLDTSPLLAALHRRESQEPLTFPARAGRPRLLASSTTSRSRRWKRGPGGGQA